MPHVQRATSEQIIEAYKATGSIWKTAKRLGLCGQSVWERLKRLNYKMAYEKWTPSEAREVVFLAEQGMPISRIADTIGRTYAAVACKLSEMDFKHPYRQPKKPKHGKGLTKIVVNKIMDHLLESDETVTKAARMAGATTTGLVTAVQFYAPLKWQQYVSSHAKLPIKKCPGCDGDFWPLNGRQKYCTNRCGGNARRDAEYFGGRRKTAIGLNEQTCQLCLKKVIQGLSAHHVIGKDRDPENHFLIALCRGCHNLVEMLAARKFVTEREAIENLVNLALLRSGACDSSQPFGVRTYVDIEILEAQEIEAT